MYYLKKYSHFDDISKPNFESNFTKQLFSTPSQILIQRVSKQYQFCKSMNILYQTYGNNNIWIVKPTSNSRGSGIYLTTDLHQIQSSSKNIQSRLVQKYIQKPLLIKNQKWNEIYMRKFDLRQWVLVKSIYPLQIYMFSECYLRLCFDKYSQKDIGQLYKHLTNYSINKKKFKNKQQSVLPLSYLRQVLQKQYNISWDQCIRPQIKQIIVKSIKSCLQNLDDCNGNCFQLFGYDILIDQQMKAWLIQINMSPACQERTPWLTDYLQDMGTGLLKLILPQDLLPHQNLFAKKQAQYVWQLVLFQQALFNRKKDVQPFLQVVGEGIRLNQQKNVDKFLIQNKMALRIQKFFKKYLPKYIQHKNRLKQNRNKIEKYFKFLIKMKQDKLIKHNYYVKQLNKFTHVFLSYQKFRKSAKERNFKTIQKYFHSILVKNKYDVDQKEYKTQVLINLGRSLIMKRQLQQFNHQIFKASHKVVKIQVKCRQFLQNKKQLRQSFYKFFKTLTQSCKFQSDKKLYLKRKNQNVIFNYFKSIYLSREADKKIVQSKKRTIYKYVLSLRNRSQFYRKRLEIFLYLVGRVQRVSKKRTRCEHFRVILTGWRNQIKNQVQLRRQTEEYNLKKLIAMSRQKMKNAQQNEKILKVAAGRQIRRSQNTKFQ